jgi:acyl-CoA synthetase (AMP-forming)/AMP-acid ligase II
MNETRFLPLLNSYLEKWAQETPDKVALIQHEDGRSFTYKQCASLVDYFALRLLDMGIRKGDRVATMLVLVPEHIFLMYACFKIGAICAPLDVRLKEHEVVRDLAKIEPKAFFFLGETPVRDFRRVGKAVQQECPYVEHLVQFTPNPKPGEILPGAVSITEMMDKKRLAYLKIKDLLAGGLKRTYAQVTPQTAALIIYTTGTTGAPKPAMINHQNIIVQNEVLKRGTGMGAQTRVLINLPPSHVGCVTENLMTTLYVGGSAVLLRIFDVKNTLEAIQKFQVNTLGMIPTQFRLVWNHPDYEKYDLSSLQFVVYGGSSVDVAFLEKMATMAPRFGTGIGMTESGGFVTFIPPGISIAEMAGQVGRCFPDLGPVSIRAPMNADGTAGIELADGEIGEICYHAPIVFMGYYNQTEATAQAISKEGILYTGDLGYFKAMHSAEIGDYRALYLSGRRKFVIKQSGYLVFPDEVEAYIAAHPAVDIADVIGLEHEILGEGIFAYVRPRQGMSLSAEEILEHCKGIASFKRPQHVELWPAGEAFPLTRSAKVDKMALRSQAEVVVERLRAQGSWDRARS